MRHQDADSHGRSIAKAISWRLLGTLDTFAITFLVTGSFGWAGSVAGVESISKLILFYLHERAWSKLRPDGEGTSPSFLMRVVRKVVRANFAALPLLASSSNLPEEPTK